jgi:hypothetical protein
LPSIVTHLGTVAVFVGVIALAVAAIVASRRFEGQHHKSSDALWDDLRKAHDLSRRETRRLKDFAEQASLSPESLIFLEPHILLRLADKDPDTQAEIRDLVAKLYG